MTPRQLLSHKLRDGKYRAKHYGCPVDPELTLAAVIDAGFLKINKCYYCGKDIGDGPGDYTLEHIEPLIKNGPHSLGNICKACPSCNYGKNIQRWLDWAAELDKVS